MPRRNSNSQPATPRRPWKDAVTPYQHPSVWRGVWQLLNTVVPYAALWYLTYRSLAAYLVKPTGMARLQQLAKALKDFWLVENQPGTAFGGE